MSNKNEAKSYLVQGSILAIASIVSRVIGLVYRIPLTAIIGDHGNDYYSTAFEIYSLILLLSSYSLPMAVSKMVSRRVATRHYKSTYQTFKGALIFATITGVIGALIIFTLAGPFCRLFKTPLAVYALRVLAPTIIIVALMAVIRGFFQGLGTMVPSAISQIIEQIVNAIVSVLAAYILYHYGLHAVQNVSNQQDYASAMGAAGGTLGTGLGALCGLLFVLLIFMAYRKSFLKKIRHEEQHRKNMRHDSYRYIMKVLVWTIIPVLLSTTVYNLVSIVDQGVFKNIAALQGMNASEVSTMWGVYAGKYRVLVNVPISIASALAVSAVPTVSAAFGRKDQDAIRRSIGLSLRFEMVVALPCTVGLMVLASPIQQLLFRDDSRLAALLLITGSISVIFYTISTLSNATLQAVDRMSVPVINALIALIVQIVAILISMFAFHNGIYSVIVANIVFSLLMCILNGRAVARATGFQPDIIKTFVKPALAAVIMGVITRLIYVGLHALIHSNAIATIVAILAAILVYAIALLLTRCLTEEELKSFPKGTTIIRFAKKLHLL